MSQTIELNAEVRSNMGKGASRRLRRTDNQVPGILYGGQKEPQALMFEHNKIMQALDNEVFYSSVVKINVNGKQEEVILKAVQRHPWERRILHLDFQRVADNNPVVVLVPLHFQGAEQAPASKLGGRVQYFTRLVKVKCLAKDLPEAINVDLKSLELNQTLHLSDIPLPSGVKFSANLRDRNQNAVVVRMMAPKGGA